MDRRITIIFITGHHNAGKTTLAQWLKNYGFVHIETGDIIRKKHKELSPGTNFNNWVNFIGQQDPDFFNKCILEVVVNAFKKIEKSNGKVQDIVVTGNRQIEGIQYICSNINLLDNKPIILYVDSSEEELFKRHFQRSDCRHLNMNRKMFKEYLELERSMGLEKIKPYADCVIKSKMNIKKTREEVITYLQSIGYNVKTGIKN